ncbi:Transport-associated protein [Pseudodesulfovibrio profundus]|uniref:Transport-associated protein n=1 Tax=Pseudodesulfovibrio profundus TaxID=57320 RepID=A0A2C8FB08_9BACT|nr:BON domain-containing protein [Pseudodesulfovibrio profundus]SOB59826.1 Transport-associated protein [Pseudodesulfovibrio profundus]
MSVMRTVPYQIIIIMLLGLLTGGCALYPAVQVAGGAMTGYDAAIIADDYLPRSSVIGGELHAKTDVTLERRLRERLDLNGIKDLKVHVIDCRAYLVGEVADRATADYAIQTAATVQGVKTIRCKFFPKSAFRKNTSDDKRLSQELATMYKRSKALQREDLRVEVVQRNAILIGLTDTGIERARAVAMAHEVGELASITDYIEVRREMPLAQAETAPAK